MRLAIPPPPLGAALLGGLLLGALLGGCATVKVEPIHITVDINIKVDRALDEFFAAVPASTAPAPGPAGTPVHGTTPDAPAGK